MPADPFLVATVNRLLERLRPLLRSEPGLALVPRAITPGIRLHALALALRQLQAGLDEIARRHQPLSTEDEIDAVLRLEAHFLRDITVAALEEREVPLPRDLKHLGHSR
jgi:hypothetical protein